jgi:starch synthase
VYPFAKTGGLADVCSFLPLALKRLGHEVQVIMPKYKSLGKNFQPVGIDIKVPVGDKIKKAFLFQSHLQNKVPIYFIENNSYFGRPQLYGNQHGDFPDNAERFIFFSRAILEFCQSTGFCPDIIHCNDWQTGLVPLYLKTHYQKDPFFKSTRSIFTIHNLGYQGNFPKENLALANISDELFTPEGVEFYGHFSFMKAGLLYADILNTVSPSYCREIQTEENGFLMDGVLRLRSTDLHGILNGVDETEWNPSHDSLIASPYSTQDLSGKLQCRKELIQLFALDPDSNRPIACMITRLSHQKGIDLIAGGLEKILDKGIDLIILGNGEHRYESYFKKMTAEFSGRFAAHIGFEEKLAHKVLAGSDLLLMPSLYEPCGLTQMYALKYGTVPLVRSVGGLRDSIKKYNAVNGRGTGFKFSQNTLADLLLEIGRALSVYNDKPSWQSLMLNGMETDNSWDNAAKKYQRLYLKALSKTKINLVGG